MQHALRLARLVNLNSDHSLTLHNRDCVKRNGAWYETQWMDEHDAAQKLVARLRTWTTKAVHPPYRKQIGWERYSLSGKLLDREVRYSKRDNNEYVH